MKQKILMEMKIYIQHFLRWGMIVFSLFFMMISCLDDRYDFNRISDNIEISPGISAPLAFGSLSIANILNEVNESGYIKEFDDKLLYITYADRLVSFRASEIINIPDQTFLEVYFDTEIASKYGFPFNMPISEGLHIELEKPQNGEFVFLNNERLDSIFLKNTTVRINAKSSFRHTGEITITSPNILINGVPFSETIVISDASGTFNETVDILLDGSKITLDNSNPDTTFLPLNFVLDLESSGADISEGDKFDVTMSFINLDFYSVYGFIGDYELLYESGGVNVELFDSQLGEGDVFFNDPQLKLEISNSYGIPVSLELSDVYAVSVIKDVTTPIVFTGVNPFFIEAPDHVGQDAITDIFISRENCNIDLALKTQPNEFFFKAKAVTNPVGSGSENNFVTDSSRIDVDFLVVLPIWVKAEGFSLTDTLDFDLYDQMGDLIDFLEYLRVTLDATNGLPMESNLQVYFADENFEILDSMFLENKAFLAPASLDDEYKVLQGTQIEHNIIFTASRLKNIKETKHAIIKADVSTAEDAETAEDTYVKFYSDYTIDFKLKLKANFNINIRNL